MKFEGPSLAARLESVIRGRQTKAALLSILAPSHRLRPFVQVELLELDGGREALKAQTLNPFSTVALIT